MIDVCMSFHLEVLSPNQWPVYLPLEGKVEREITTPLFPVTFWTPLHKNKINNGTNFILKWNIGKNVKRKEHTSRWQHFRTIRKDYAQRNEGIRRLVPIKWVFK